MYKSKFRAFLIRNFVIINPPHTFFKTLFPVSNKTHPVQWMRPIETGKLYPYREYLRVKYESYASENNNPKINPKVTHNNKSVIIDLPFYKTLTHFFWAQCSDYPYTGVASTLPFLRLVHFKRPHNAIMRFVKRSIVPFTCWQARYYSKSLRFIPSEGILKSSAYKHSRIKSVSHGFIPPTHIFEGIPIYKVPYIQCPYPHI